MEQFSVLTGSGELVQFPVEITVQIIENVVVPALYQGGHALIYVSSLSRVNKTFYAIVARYLTMHLFGPLTRVMPDMEPNIQGLCNYSAEKIEKIGKMPQNVFVAWAGLEQLIFYLILHDDAYYLISILHSDRRNWIRWDLSLIHMEQARLATLSYWKAIRDGNGLEDVENAIQCAGDVAWTPWSPYDDCDLAHLSCPVNAWDINLYGEIKNFTDKPQDADQNPKGYDLILSNPYTDRCMSDISYRVMYSRGEYEIIRVQEEGPRKCERYIYYRDQVCPPTLERVIKDCHYLDVWYVNPRKKENDHCPYI